MGASSEDQPGAIGTANGGPLSGLVVADFTRVLAGPYCAMLLGDLGAEVIKVESPTGDDTRHWVPPIRDGMSTYFMGINRNKRSIVLDLAQPGDVEVAHALSARADIFIQNFKPGGLVRFGLDYDGVRSRNTGIIYCSISGFGSDKGAALPGYDMLVQGVSGLMSLTGSADGPPFRAGFSVFDVLTGLHAAVGILAAVHHRSATGQGQHVETNLLSAALSTLANQASAYVAGDLVPHRMGNAHPNLFPYEPLQTGDGELIVVAGNDGQFRKLCGTMGLDTLPDDERFDTVGKRNINRDDLRPILVDRLATRSAQEWFEIFTSVGVPSGPINDVRGGVELATELGLEPVVLAGNTPTVRNPVSLSETPARYARAAPELGADAADIRDWLGFGRPPD
ncbi:MAG: L-carnitine dehydratase/bile acid-inducible protein [Frankiales bacterium]|nr:L-carnitine dehydratase/bile acid-inducible protein [Frankiales bacterium]